MTTTTPAARDLPALGFKPVPLTQIDVAAELAAAVRGRQEPLPLLDAEELELMRAHAAALAPADIVRLLTMLVRRDIHVDAARWLYAAAELIAEALPPDQRGPRQGSLSTALKAASDYVAALLQAEHAIPNKRHLPLRHAVPLEPTLLGPMVELVPTLPLPLPSEEYAG